MMTSLDIKQIADSAAAFHRWMFGDALPFWATTGRDRLGFGFHECLELDGRAADIDFKRIRVQARQIYSYSHASLLGWTDGIDVAASGYDFINAHGWRESGGWARLLGRNGGVIDQTPDLYDNAFVLFALSWYARATQSDAILARAQETLTWIVRSMRVRDGVGFENWLGEDGGFRQQNPHMHLLEAVLALHATAPNQALLDLASELVGLFRRHFLDRTTGTLAEFFARDLSPAPGDAGTRVEPGHHYEWVWLLQQYQAITGDDVSAEADLLYDFAEQYGINKNTGFIVNALGKDGTVRDAAARLWPQTEELKAHLAIHERTGVSVGPKVERVVQNLLQNYLACDPPGTWIDVFDGTGKPLVSRIPTSSFYHIFVAFAELDRVARDISIKPPTPRPLIG